MIKHVSLIWLASMLGAGAAFLIQVILARQLGAADFGVFSAALAAVTLLAPLAAFGVGGFWLKVFGQEGWRGLRWVRPSIVFSIFFTTAATALIFVWALVGPHDDRSSLLFMVLSSYIASQAVIEITSARFQLEERYFSLALWQFMPHCLRLFSVGVLVLVFGTRLSPESVAITYALVAAMLLALGVPAIVEMLRGKVSLQGHGDRPGDYSASMAGRVGLAAVLRDAWPFGLAGVFYLIFYQSNIVLLKYLAGDELAGLYSVAFVIISAVYMFPSVVYQKYLLPKIHRWANCDLPKLHRVYIRGNYLVAIVGIVAMVGVIVLGPFAITLLFGGAFASSATPLLILSLAIPLRFVATSAGAMLVTQDNMRRKIRYMGFVAGANVIMNIILIPRYGMTGAAISAVLSEGALLALYQHGARKFVFMHKNDS